MTEPLSSDTCSSRRGVLKGASALALATAALRMRAVLAEDGTPVATPAGEDAAKPPSWLFTQTFREGDWEKTETEGSFTLHLRGGLASTVGFTDRPHRDFMVMPTGDLLPQLWSDPTNPPNAAIIVEDAGTQYTFLLVLRDPVYDEAGDQITYTVSLLESYTGDGLGEVVERVADGALPQTFGAGAIFVDSWGCKDSTKACRRVYYNATCEEGQHWQVEDGHLAGSEQWTNTCFVNGHGCNLPCPAGTSEYNNWCNATYPDWCYETSEYGCVFATNDLSVCCSCDTQDQETILRVL